LFEVPLAALPDAGKENSGVHPYLIEHHAIRLLSGISTSTGGWAVDQRGPIVGVGDPIYNRADSRLAASDHAATSTEGEPYELPRLAGTSRELASYASIWRAGGYQPILLEGSTATRDDFLSALRMNPAVVHIAAHVVFPPQTSGSGLLALSIHPGGEIELLSANEIAALRLRLGLVVVNACASGVASTVPGSGLMGMTRAWLAAGAHAVILTRWPISDQESSDFFRTFYDQLASAHTSPPPSFGELLRHAQLSELRAGGRRGNPANWGAYFSVERN
jgi:CHAT domain-containing protein